MQKRELIYVVIVKVKIFQSLEIEIDFINIVITSLDDSEISELIQYIDADQEIFVQIYFKQRVPYYPTHKSQILQLIVFKNQLLRAFGEVFLDTFLC